MKLFQKSALAVAIAAVPFLSVNAMEALDDATLSEMTGQAGVTIETEVNAAGITIGSIEYTDTLDGSGTDIGGGKLIIDNNGQTGPGITIQGWDIDNDVAASSYSRQKIDINSGGDLITKTENVDGFGGTVITESAKKLSVGAVNLADSNGANKVSLVSDLEMVMVSGNSEAHIINVNGTTADLTAYDIGADAGVVNASAASNGKIAIVTRSKSRIHNLDVKALDGAVSITGLSYGGGANGDQLMESTQVIWTVNETGSTANKNGVYIQGSDSVGTLKINEIAIGGGVIGAVKISDISQKGSTMRIYGH